MSIDRILAGQVAYPRAEAQAGVYRVFIRDLVLSCSIGVYDHERLAPQRVRVNVDVTAREPGAALDDDIGKVVSYDDLVRRVRSVTGEGHINLVETLAERVAALCLADERVVVVRVRVEKPDVIVDAAGVGVEIERRRSDASREEAAVFPPLPGGV
jgi:7,8-dihydroneopterin aldolase/epimerase/oxygenase